jgi:protein-tyrosine phosphatase
MGFVDLHSHVLPALDDGVQSLDEAVQVLDALCQIGFTVVCATPHQKVGSWVPSTAEIGKAHAAVRAALDQAGSVVELRLGAENFWDELFVTRSQKGDWPCYSGEQAFLVEISPVHVPMAFEDELFRLRTRGKLPVLAHPERYHRLCENQGRIEGLARTAALVVDLGALEGAHGRAAEKSAQWLVKEGFASACASDVHSIEDVRAAASGIHWIKKRLGDSAVRRLLDDNPRRILQGELPD